MKKLLFLLVTLITSVSYGADTLNVAIKENPPFVIVDPTTGHIGGLSIELITNVLQEEKIPFKFEVKTDEFNTIVNNPLDYDIFVSSTSITSDRIKHINFTQPYYYSSTTVVMPKTTHSLTDILLTWKFLKNVVILFIVVIALGTIFWLVERRRSELFTKGPWGILDGSYFVTAVMGTFGFGDIVTKTKTGKIICIFLMWLSLGITGIFIANISSALTVAALDEDEFRLNELTKIKVGTIEGTTSAKFLHKNGIKYVTYDTPSEALNDINEGNLNAFVYDAPVLKYFLSQDRYEGLKLAPIDFAKQTYGFVSTNDELIRKINPRLLKFIQSDEWIQTLSKYNLD